MSWFRGFLFGSEVRLRTFNQWFVYALNLGHGFLNLMPPPLRNLGFRLALGRVGRHVYFDYGVYVKFPWLVEMGDHVSLNRGVQFFPGFRERSRIVLGSHVYVGPGVSFFAAGHEVREFSRHTGADIVVEDQVWLGAGAIILQGVRVGANSVVGAGSVVTEDVPPGTIVAGSPARVIRSLSS